MNVTLKLPDESIRFKACGIDLVNPWEFKA